MRIIAGMLGGRKINPPAKMPYTRPTTDVAKEGLFNVLQHRIDFEEIKTLDLFGGTGSISYELASRGAADLTIVEKDNAMFDFIKKTAAGLNIDNIKCIKMDVFRYLETCSTTYDFIFAGPPYALTSIDELPKIIVGKQLLNPNGWFVLEHTPRNDYKQFEKYSFEKNYGTTIFSVFINQ
ncbi:RsmD family RNA methyltransferase [Niabella beijingensis]|uniref:RsmD family RNA methyltransferase n=1 Tax=Niabella beijingensis TaxID=2872700 RepID=UPI001CBD813B|nr:RsmD family RNA methyltransferase [Niabella beijingensis]MBZ4191221.1 RsmD family RNA methyltransferase [Niabella beijingensis]